MDPPLLPIFTVTSGLELCGVIGPSVDGQTAAQRIAIGTFGGEDVFEGAMLLTKDDIGDELKLYNDRFNSTQCICISPLVKRRITAFVS